jgi:hypothetical protein
MATSELEAEQIRAQEQAAQEGSPASVRLPDRDVRRKRPPALLFLLRVETLRQLLRILALLTIDFVGLYAAIFTGLAVKALAQDKFNFDIAFAETRRTFAFGYLVMVLLFARSSLYADRALRPGLAKIVSCLFQTTLVTLIFAVLNGNRFSS